MLPHRWRPCGDDDRPRPGLAVVHPPEPTTPSHHRRKPRLKLIGLGVAAVAAASVAAVAAVPDQAAIKARVAEAVRRSTGRTLVLQGPISIWPGLSLTLAADDVTLSNIQGGSRPEMARVGRLEARVAWLPLFNREIVVERLTLEHPSILLETTAEAVPNWRFEPPRPTASPAAVSSGSPSRPWRSDVRVLELRDGDVELRDGRVGRAVKATVPRLTLAATSAESPISVDGEIGLGTERTRISGQVGSFSAFESDNPASP